MKIKDFGNEVAYSVGKDEADRFIKKLGMEMYRFWKNNKQTWTLEAYNEAVKERNRIMDTLYPGEER